MKTVKKSLFLTTFDNPYNPSTQFDDWYNFDCEKQYFTTNYINRVVRKNHPNSVENESNELFIVEAMKEIVNEFPNVYRIVEEDEEQYTIDVRDEYMGDE